MTDSPNDTPGGCVYRFDDNAQKWIDCGRLAANANSNNSPIEAINGLVVYRGQLYASSTYSPGFFRYEGGTTWSSLGTANNRRVVPVVRGLQLIPSDDTNMLPSSPTAPGRSRVRPAG